jgi:DNA ligase (NAD+)
LAKIDGIGEIVGQSIVNYFRNKKNLKLIRNLKKFGLRFKSGRQIPKRTFLKGKIFVFTGELAFITRQEAETKVRKLGGHPSSSVSKRTDFVIAGKNPGSKYKKAQKLGVKIISEQEFLNMISKESTD